MIRTLILFLGLLTFAEAAERPLALVGNFYGSDFQDLKSFIKEKVQGPRAPHKPRIIITPHDRFFKSGSTAGKAFRQIKGYKYDAILLLGPYHEDMFEGAVVWNQGPWQTPWGALPIHAELARAIVDNLGDLQKDTNFHLKEHSLETQIPYLAVVQPKTPIVPILISHNKFYKPLADAITKAIQGRDVLIVVSTDLCHYQSLKNTNIIDARTLKLLEEGAPEPMDEAIDNYQIELCGSAPTLTALEIGRSLGWNPPEVIEYTTSSPISGKTDWVVGYVAARAFA